MVRRLFFFIAMIAVLLTACTDNDSFSTGTGNRLSFSEDTIRFDTLFSTIPSATQTFWVRNESGDGIRIRTARLERSNQSGYRVNVDGTYLDPVGSDFEVRKGDSILVFVEITTRENHSLEPQLVEDNLIFTLESGVEQRVNLRTYSWDAMKMTDLVVSRDTTIESSVPILVYGKGISVEEGATLTLRNTDFYFHDGAGIEAKGNVMAESCLFRGDRLDHMFDYLPYDRVSGQWRGIRLSSTTGYSYFASCEIRNAVDAVICDSTRTYFYDTVIHNSSGNGIYARHSTVFVDFCQLSNAYGDCLGLFGCYAQVTYSTLAQFYPFSANRGYALHFVNTKQYHMTLECMNTLVTGYADDVVMGVKADSTTTDLVYHFTDCLLRTPKKEDEEHIVRVIFETPKDSVQGKQHFKTIDEENLYYDFTLDSISPAFQNGIGRGASIPQSEVRQIKPSGRVRSLY